METVSKNRQKNRVSSRVSANPPLPPYRHHPLLLLQPRGRTRGGRSARPSPPRSLFGFCCSFVAVLLPAPPPSVPSAAAAAAAAAFFPPVSVAPTARAASPMGAPPLCFLRLRGCSVPLLPHRSRRKTPLERRRKTLQCSLPPPRLTLRRPLFPSAKGCQVSEFIQSIEKGDNP